MTLTITGNLDVGKDVNISNSGFAFNINVAGNVDIDKDGIVSANITAGGDFKTRGGVIFNGDISAASDVDIDKDNIINGNVAASGNLNIDKKSVVNGICSPTLPTMHRGRQWRPNLHDCPNCIRWRRISRNIR